MDSSLAQQKWPENFNGTSIMAGFLTFDIFEKLKNEPGWPLARAINVGVKHPLTRVGLHAGHPDCYEKTGG